MAIYFAQCQNKRLEEELMRGYLEQRGSKWSFILTIGYDENGKRIQKRFSGYSRKKDAEAAMAEKIREITQGTYTEPSKELLKDFLLSWLEEKKTKVRMSTWKSYRWLINRHIIPHLGRIRMDQLQPRHIQQMYVKMQQELSERSVHHAHRVLCQALGQAEKWGSISRNTAKLVDPPKPKRTEMQVWDREEVMKFLDIAKWNRYYMAFHLALATGMRKGEILGLRWSDIDFEKQTLSVRQTLGRAESGHQLQEPKTKHSVRTIAIDKQTVSLLRKHRKEQTEEMIGNRKEWKDHNLVICTSVGTPLLPRNLDRAWFALLKKSGLRSIRFHDLRHTHATLLLKQGVHPKVVSERLGHSSVSLTMDTYSHVLPNMQAEVAEAFGQSLFGDKNENAFSL